jgi:RNA recognition motif-containing protein
MYFPPNLTPAADKDTGISRGTAFVKFDSRAAASMCVDTARAAARHSAIGADADVEAEGEGEGGDGGRKKKVGDKGKDREREREIERASHGGIMVKDRLCR